MRVYLRIIDPIRCSFANYAGELEGEELKDIRFLHLDHHRYKGNERTKDRIPNCRDSWPMSLLGLKLCPDSESFPEIETITFWYDY